MQAPIRVLIVDDDALVSSVIESEVIKTGMVVIGRATDGREALQLTLEKNPDVILMDIEMPEMNGIQAAQNIQKNHPTPIVFLTGYEAKTFLKLAADVGGGAYLVKPPKALELERAILIAQARHQDLMTLQKLNQELKSALEEIKTLRGFIPICAWCKKIRNDEGYWQEIDAYLSQKLNADLSHGICPTCKDKATQDLSADDKE